MNNLETKIEAILFFKGEPMSLKRLGDILKVSKEEILEAVSNLKNSLSGRGIVLLEKPARQPALAKAKLLLAGNAFSIADAGGESEIMLGTAPVFSELIENLQKEELNKDLSKASLETLSIILYRNGASRSEIDYIRGVNSSFTLRALSVRGLIEKTTDLYDNRKFIYKPSFDTLSFMGLKKVEELPEFGEVNTLVETGVETMIDENSNPQ